MTINVLVNGAFGRMGQLTVKAISEHPELSLVGQTGREYDLKRSIKDSQADVVVDFTHPSAVFNNTLAIIESGARPIIGTSGLTHEQIHSLQKKCDSLKLGGIVAPNFSLGAVLMMKYAQKIATLIPNVEIIEMHHTDKADSPSGTALRTAQLINESRQTSHAKHEPFASAVETVQGARGATYQDIAIHSIRLPGLLAHQQILFGSLGETLTLRHDSIDRQCFMGGVCFACEKVMSLNHLVYGLEELL